MKKTLILVFTLLSTCIMWGKQLSQSEAMDVARNFFGQSGDLRSAEEIKLAAVAEELTDINNLRSATGESAFYVFNRGNSGFVIVAGDDRMKQVLGYSKNNAFVTENIPANLKAMLNAYSALHANLDKAPNPIVKSELRSSDQFAEDVQPLLGEISWDQGEPYNLDCPEMEGGRAVTGCLATAMAMVMKYHGYPVKGNGSYSYVTQSGITCSFDYGNTTFDWDNMLPQYENVQYTEEQAKAVAELMYACGVSINMEYSPAESGAAFILIGDALINHFNYNRNLGFVLRDYFTSEEWMNMLKRELNEKRPVLYGGTSLTGGHEFVIDGYDKDNLVHVNWGWGGIANGYFEIASLDRDHPGLDNESIKGYSMYQNMIIGMQPESGDFSYTSFFAVDNININKTEVKKEEKIKLDINYLANMTTTFHKGELALLIENQDKEQTPIFTNSLSKAIKNMDAPINSVFEFAIPSSVEDGVYKLYLATKEEREKEYSKVRGTMGSVVEYTLTVEGDSCSLVPSKGLLDVNKDLVVEIESPEKLFSGGTHNLKINIANTNSKSEFLGEIGLVLLNKNTSETITKLGNSVQLFIPEETEKEFEMPVSFQMIDENNMPKNIPVGEYIISPYIYWGNNTYFLEYKIPISIINLNVSNVLLEKAEIGIGEKLNYSAELMLDGNCDEFAGDILSVIVNYETHEIVEICRTSISFDKTEQPYKLDEELDINLNPGKYYFAIFLANGDNHIQLIKPLVFSVSTNPTSIEAQPDGTDGLTVYGINGGNNIRIKTSDLAEQAEIYTINGQKVLQETLTPGVGNIYNLNAANISDGVYIMVVRTSDGKVYRAKFRM